MKVKATRLCYVGHRRRYPGDVFYVEESAFSPRYMMCLDGSVKNAEKPKPKSQGKVSSDLSMDELYAYCKDHGLSGYSGLTKDELVDAINEDELSGSMAHDPKVEPEEVTPQDEDDVI